MIDRQRLQRFHVLATVGAYGLAVYPFWWTRVEWSSSPGLIRNLAMGPLVIIMGRRPEYSAKIILESAGEK